MQAQNSSVTNQTVSKPVMLVLPKIESQPDPSQPRRERDLHIKQPSLTPRQRGIKRTFDLVLATTAFLAFMPLMSIIALAIKLTSPGPILFKQDRVGENGRIFKIYKFRSMVSNAEKLQFTVNSTTSTGQTLHKHRNDPRVTGVGRIIRKTSLDELPQLLNVIRGDMSMVGPRPELPWLVEMYEPWQHRRFDVPQGITGWWQVNGRSDKPCHLNTEQDVYYIEHYSLGMDIVILAKTVPALLKGKGAF